MLCMFVKTTTLDGKMLHFSRRMELLFLPVVGMYFFQLRDRDSDLDDSEDVVQWIHYHAKDKLIVVGLKEDIHNNTPGYDPWTEADVINDHGGWEQGERY